MVSRPRHTHEGWFSVRQVTPPCEILRSHTDETMADCLNPRGMLLQFQILDKSERIRLYQHLLVIVVRKLARSSDGTETAKV